MANLNLIENLWGGLKRWDAPTITDLEIFSKKQEFANIIKARCAIAYRLLCKGLSVYENKIKVLVCNHIISVGTVKQ